MGQNSGIEYVDSSTNFWVGCKKVDEGCKNCYMFRDLRNNKRFRPDMVQRTSPSTWTGNRRWKEPRVVYIETWGDLFHPSAFTMLDEAWCELRKTPRHFYFVSTRRVDRIDMSVPWNAQSNAMPNLMVHASCSTQKAFDTYWPILAQSKLKYVGVSLAPMLEPIKLDFGMRLPDWVIVEGETDDIDPRPFDLAWAFSIMNVCNHEGIPFWFKGKGGTSLYEAHQDIPERLNLHQRPTFIDGWLAGHQPLPEPEQLKLI